MSLRDETIPSNGSLGTRSRRASKAEKHKWTKAERAKIRELAPLGMVAIRKAFPELSYNAVHKQAYSMGIRFGRPQNQSAYRGRIPLPPHAHPLVKQLIVHANQQKTFLHEIAERAGIASHTLSNWRYQSTPHLVGLIAALNVLGLDLAIVHRKEGA